MADQVERVGGTTRGQVPDHDQEGAGGEDGGDHRRRPRDVVERRVPPARLDDRGGRSARRAPPPSTGTGHAGSPSTTAPGGTGARRTPSRARRARTRRPPRRAGPAPREPPGRTGTIAASSAIRARKMRLTVDGAGPAHLARRATARRVRGTSPTPHDLDVARHVDSWVHEPTSAWRAPPSVLAPPRQRGQWCHGSAGPATEGRTALPSVRAARAPGRGARRGQGRSCRRGG